MSKQTSAVATPAQGTWEGYLEGKAFMEKLALKLQGVDPSYYVSVALSAIKGNSLLRTCKKPSVAACILNAAQIGLSLDPADGEAYLVPFKDGRSGGRNAVLIRGYRGLVKLALRSDKVFDIFTGVVFQGEEFEFEHGFETKLRHKPKWRTEAPKPDDILGFYTVWDLGEGRHHYAVMSKAEVDAVRDRSPSARGRKPSGPWFDGVFDYIEMGKKTVLRRAAKTGPSMTLLDQQLLQAALREVERGEARMDQATVSESGELIMDPEPEEAFDEGPPGSPENPEPGYSWEDDDGRTWRFFESQGWVLDLEAGERATAASEATEEPQNTEELFDETSGTRDPEGA